MRTLTSLQPQLPSFPLLESADLPGAEDWNVLESLHFESLHLNDALDDNDDQLASLMVAPSFDD